MLLVLSTASCEDGGGGSSNSVTIPPSDGSSPSIGMDGHFNMEQRPFLSVTNGSAPQQANVVANEVVTFIAQGSDPDGGVKTVEIFATFKKCVASGSCSGPGLAGAPIAANPDPNQNKGPGDTAAKSRIVNFNLDVQAQGVGADSLEAKVWAKVTNFSGQKRETPEVTINEPL